MNERARRPAPRTLAATPPPSSRSPHSTQYQARFPSLVAVIAGGALVPACDAPQCGETRADELQSHGAESLRSARRGRASEALREIGVALGVVSHSSVQHAAGAVPVATTLPRVQPPVPQVVPPPVEYPQIQPQGGPMVVAPVPVVTPPTPTTPSTTRPTSPTPHRSPVRGGARRVNPQPPRSPESISMGAYKAAGPLPDDSATTRTRLT